MDPFTIAAIGAQALSGITQGITGIFQKAKAKRMAQANKRPFYNIPTPISDNQAMAERNASRGISGAARNLYQQQSDRMMTSGIDAITAGGGNLGNIAALYGAGQDGISRMAILDDSMRSMNQKNLEAQNNTMADQMDKQWQINHWSPYADKAQAAAALSKQGTDNTWKGINSIVGAAANASVANQYEKEQANVFSGPGNDGRGYAGGIDNMPTTADRGYPDAGSVVPRPIMSTLFQNQPTTSQRVENKWNGLLMGGLWSGGINTTVQREANPNDPGMSQSATGRLSQQRLADRATLKAQGYSDRDIDNMFH